MCRIFGIVPSTLQVWLDYAIEVLIHIVRSSAKKDFEIRWPNVDEMKASSALLQTNRVHGPLLQGIFAITDRDRMPFLAYTNPDEENAFCKEFTQGY